MPEGTTSACRDNREDIPSSVSGIIGHFSRADIYDRPDISFYKLNSMPYKCPDSIRLNFNNSVANGYWDILNFTNDMLMYVVDNHYTADFQVPYRSRCDHVVFRFALSGKMKIQSSGDSWIALDGPCLTFFSTPKRRRVKLHYQKDSDHRMITIYVSREKLRNLIHPDQSADCHRTSYFFNNETQYGCSIALAPELRNAVIDVFSGQFFGPLRRLYMQAKANELLCHAIRQIVPDFDASMVSVIKSSDQERVRDAFEILNEQYIDPPQISELSRKIGLNRTVLRKYFKMIYGQTISEFCVNKRMIEARSKLLNSDMNITQISHYLGYQHPANFTTAFKRHYGMLPKDLKKH